MPPKIRRIETSATKSSITAKAIVSRLKDGTVEYYYKLSTAEDSSYTKVTDVTENGITVNTGIIEGETYTVKVIAKNENGEDTLTKDILAVDTILAESITLNETSYVVTGENSWTNDLPLVATIKPDNATNKEVTWTSSKPEIATVDSNGLVKATANGKGGNVEITATTKDGTNLTAKCNITVEMFSEIKTTKTTYTDSEGNIAIVPPTFAVGTSDNVNKITGGLVIQDNEGNQFVWIPVGNIQNKDGSTTNITLGRYTFKRVKNDSTEEYEDGTPTLVQNAINYATKKNLNTGGNYYYQELIESTTNTPARDLGAFVSKTNNSGGYYLARYEASGGSGNTTTSKVKSQYNKTVWNNITQPNAATVARNMYESNYYESDLVNSYMWDTAIVFIQKYSENTNYANKTSVNNSSIGKLNTGKSGDKVCNIYDLASNVTEWTTERYTATNYPCTYRGGHYNGSISYTAAYRSVVLKIDDTGNTYGFRSGLYLK